MDFIEGEVIEAPTESDYFEKVIQMLDHFSSLKSDVPGSLSRSPYCGFLWPESEDLTLDCVKETEAWFNSRLLPGEGILHLRAYELVLSHLDIAPRNIIWQPDGTICLLDWSSTGFYPRLFEFWAPWNNIKTTDNSFTGLLLDYMKLLPDSEIAQMAPLCQAWRNNQKYDL